MEGREEREENKRRRRGGGSFRVKFFRLTEHSSFEKGSFRNCYHPERLVGRRKNGETCLIKWESVLLPAKVGG